MIFHVIQYANIFDHFLYCISLMIPIKLEFFVFWTLLRAPVLFCWFRSRELSGDIYGEWLWGERNPRLRFWNLSWTWGWRILEFGWMSTCPFFWSWRVLFFLGNVISSERLTPLELFIGVFFYLSLAFYRFMTLVKLFWIFSGYFMCGGILALGKNFYKLVVFVIF